MRDMTSTLQKYEDRLATHNKLGTSAKDPKHVDKVKALQEDVDGVTPQMDYVDALMDGFSGPSAQTSAMAQDVERVKDRHRGLQTELADLLQDLEAGGQIVSDFQVLTCHIYDNCLTIIIY